MKNFQHAVKRTFRNSMERLVCFEELSEEQLELAANVADGVFFEESVLVLCVRKRHEAGAPRSPGAHTSWNGFEVDEEACVRLTEFFRLRDERFACNTFVLRSFVGARDELAGECAQLQVGELMLLGVNRVSPYNKRECDDRDILDLLMVVDVAVPLRT